MSIIQLASLQEIHLHLSLQYFFCGPSFVSTFVPQDIFLILDRFSSCMDHFWSNIGNEIHEFLCSHFYVCWSDLQVVYLFSLDFTSSYDTPSNRIECIARPKSKRKREPTPHQPTMRKPYWGSLLSAQPPHALLQITSIPPTAFGCVAIVGRWPAGEGPSLGAAWRVTYQSTGFE